MNNLLRAMMLMVLMLLTHQAHAKLNNEVAFYINTYGELTVEQDPKVADAQRVFKKVLSAADRNSKRLPKLVVINNKTHAWAIALPAGHIVLSRQVLDIVRRNADPELADTRLAFVLGHELAHLANDDYWHHEVESFMQNNADAQKIAEFIKQNFKDRQAELAADDKGYIYAAMAGYPVDRLLRKKSSNNSQDADQDFFTFWMQQTNTKTSPTHPQAKDRAELLRQRLYQINQKLAFFRFGTRLANFGYCNDAIYFLKEFQKVFPGRSVLNNLGLCFLHQARSQMQQQHAAFYWLPLTLDTRSRADVSRRGGFENLQGPQQFLKNYSIERANLAGYLEDAVNVLSLAVAKDPLYLAARINLAIAYLYQGKPHQARAVLAEAKQQSTTNPHIEMLDALALYEQTDADLDLWATAVKKLEQLEQKDQSPHVVYNHARLLSVRPRLAEAQTMWNRLRAQADSLPEELRQELCTQQNLDSVTTCMARKTTSVSKLNLNWLFTTSLEPLSNTEREQIATAWQSIAFDWASAELHGFIHQHNNGSSEMLEMNHTVQMQVLKGNPVVDINQINRNCQHPLKKRKLDEDEVWTCDTWAVLVSNQQAKEIWYVQK
ncbi:MAG: M48 family metalloprotease [Methylococcales bacterium]